MALRHVSMIVLVDLGSQKILKILFVFHSFSKWAPCGARCDTCARPYIAQMNAVIQPGSLSLSGSDMSKPLVYGAPAFIR